jgi:hypothetical protein
MYTDHAAPNNILGCQSVKISAYGERYGLRSILPTNEPTIRARMHTKRLRSPMQLALGLLGSI